VASHEKFIAKYQLPFPLLSDPEHKMAEAYGVWVEKNMYGKKYMGTERSTFVIDSEGGIAKIFRRVKPEEHVELLQSALGG
jgi:thioredoxin-dependent peroxiredoxin